MRGMGKWHLFPVFIFSRLRGLRGFDGLGNILPIFTYSGLRVGDIKSPLRLVFLNIYIGPILIFFGFVGLGMDCPRNISPYLHMPCDWFFWLFILDLCLNILFINTGDMSVDFYQSPLQT